MRRSATEKRDTELKKHGISRDMKRCKLFAVCKSGPAMIRQEYERKMCADQLRRGTERIKEVKSTRIEEICKGVDPGR